MSIGICFDCGRPFYQTQQSSHELNSLWISILNHNGHRLGLYEIYDFKLKEGELYLNGKLVKTYGNGSNEYIHLNQDLYDDLINYAKNAK